MLRANLTSVVPPNFRKNSFCTSPIQVLPISSPCNAGTRRSLLGIRNLPLGPLLEGYFHNTVMKISTCHLLSGHRNIVYSSLSLHLLCFYV